MCASPGAWLRDGESAGDPRLGMRLLSVPRATRADDGPDLAKMEAPLREHRLRLYVTESVLHKPTGASLSAAAVQQQLNGRSGASQP